MIPRAFLEFSYLSFEISHLFLEEAQCNRDLLKPPLTTLAALLIERKRKLTVVLNKDFSCVL